MPTSISTWVDQIRGGNLRALSQAITAVENRTPESLPLLQALFAYSGRARIVGITGSPGAGKSTLVDALATQFRARQQTVGIIAIDPTSPFSGGAILGDRIRMQSHTTDEGIFIRSMATRGALGGLSSAAADVATVLDASGRDLVLIETVGAGQDEVDIVRLADLTLVVLVPGMGDDVQSIKAGILEIADIFVINKSDREGAARVERELRAMQSLSTRADGWVPPIVQTVATSGRGIDALLASIDEYESFLAANSLGHQRRIANWRIRLRDNAARRAAAPHRRAAALRGRHVPIRRPGRQPPARPVFPHCRTRGADCPPEFIKGRHPMLILGIDTSGKQGSVALLQAPDEAPGGPLRIVELAPLAGGHYSEQLVPAIAGLLERHGLEKRSLSLLAVASGPGSFTGLRVAIATVKGLAEALAIPVVPVSVLEAILLDSPAQGRAVAAIDAQRGEVFFAEFIAGQLREQIATVAAFIAALAAGPTPTVFTPDEALAARLREAAPSGAEALILLLNWPSKSCWFHGPLPKTSPASPIANSSMASAPTSSPSMPITCAALTPNSSPRPSSAPCPNRDEHSPRHPGRPFAADAHQQFRQLRRALDPTAVARYLPFPISRTPGLDCRAAGAALPAARPAAKPDADGCPTLAAAVAAKVEAHDAPNREAFACGFLVAQCGGPEWELENLAVLPVSRRRGVGAALLATLLEEARARHAERILLEVRASNQSAIRLYAQAGFQLLARRRGYYQNPTEDALLFGHPR